MQQPGLIWIPANPANFMYGRQGTPVQYIAFHHVVGTASSAVNRFLQPVQVSAHFIVASDRIYCMVDTDNTAYCNGDWLANLDSVCIEHEGTWLNGFRDEGVIENSARLVAWLRSLYPAASPRRHRDFIPTACPGDLPVEEIWQRASDILSPPLPPSVPTPEPTPIVTTPEWLNNRVLGVKTMYANKGNVQLWNLDDPTTPADTRLFATNTKFDVGAETTVGGRKYYITTYSTAKNIGCGFRADDLSDSQYQEPVQPPAATPEPAPAPTPPVVVEIPTTPTPQPTPQPPKKKTPWLVSLFVWVLNLPIFNKNKEKKQ